MTGNTMLETATAILVYFGFFAVGGYRRGLKQELLTGCVSLLVLVCLIWYLGSAQRLPSTLAELAAGLDISQASLMAVSQSWSAMTAWILACLGTYWLGSRLSRAPGPVSMQLAGAVVAMGNGLVYWLLLIPWLTTHIRLEPAIRPPVLPAATLPIALPLAETMSQAQSWLTATSQYGPTILVVLGIGILLYFMSRRRRTRVPDRMR